MYSQALLQGYRAQLEPCHAGDRIQVDELHIRIGMRHQVIKLDVCARLDIRLTTPFFVQSGLLPYVIENISVNVIDHLLHWR